MAFDYFFPIKTELKFVENCFLNEFMLVTVYCRKSIEWTTQQHQKKLRAPQRN